MEFKSNGRIATTKIEPLGQLYMKDYFEQMRIVVSPVEHAEKKMYIAAPATP